MVSLPDDFQIKKIEALTRAFVEELKDHDECVAYNVATALVINVIFDLADSPADAIVAFKALLTSIKKEANDIWIKKYGRLS